MENDGLTYRDLNAMINLWSDNKTLQLDKDKMAVKKYFLEDINLNTVFFHNLEERISYLIDNDYYDIILHKHNKRLNMDWLYFPIFFRTKN